MASDKMRFAFVGDVSLGFLKQCGIASTDWSSTHRLLGTIGPHDCLVGNLECCLVDGRCNDEEREHLMAAPTAAARLLQEAGFSALSLANNHMLDCGPRAVAVTRESLSQVGIQAFGAGQDLLQAEDTLFEEKLGRRIAYLGACDSARYYASDRKAGIAPLDKKRLQRRVRDAAAQADLVIVCLHADVEFCSVPAPWRQRLSRWLIDQGADLVIQHHPHVLQGVESYRGGLIAYSLGNFIFPLDGNSYQQHRTGVFDSAVLVVDVRFTGAGPDLSHRIVPARIESDHFPHHLTANAARRATMEFRRRCALVGRRDLHRRLWFKQCRQEAAARLRALYYRCRRAQFSSGAHDFALVLRRKQDRRWVLGLFTLGYF